MFGAFERKRKFSRFALVIEHEVQSFFDLTIRDCVWAERQAVRGADQVVC